MALAPGLVLAILVIGIATSVTRLAVGGRGPWALSLSLSVAGLAGGELLANTGRLTRPSVGVIHPVADLLVIAAVQITAALMMMSGAD